MKPAPLDLSTRYRRIVVISPHLDDAALSLGATIAHAARAGARVTVLTPLSGEVDSDDPPGRWDRDCGWSSAGDAARGRRQEDVAACELLGATPEWLPFRDVDYTGGERNDDVWPAIEARLAGADLVLIPGFPLDHLDHGWLSELLLERMAGDGRVALYVEQPYANVRVVGRGYRLGPLLGTARLALREPRLRRRQVPRLEARIAPLLPDGVDWVVSVADRPDRALKRRAIEAYASQLEGLGRQVAPRIRLYERGWGGEGIGFPRTPSAGLPSGAGAAAGSAGSRSGS